MTHTILWETALLVANRFRPYIMYIANIAKYLQSGYSAQKII